MESYINVEDDESIVEIISSDDDEKQDSKIANSSKEQTKLLTTIKANNKVSFFNVNKNVYKFYLLFVNKRK